MIRPRKDKPLELTIPKSWVHKEAMLKEILEQRKDEEGIFKAVFTRPQKNGGCLPSSLEGALGRPWTAMSQVQVDWGFNNS